MSEEITYQEDLERDPPKKTNDPQITLRGKIRKECIVFQMHFYLVHFFFIVPIPYVDSDTVPVYVKVKLGWEPQLQRRQDPEVEAVKEEVVAAYKAEEKEEEVEE